MAWAPLCTLAQDGGRGRVVVENGGREREQDGRGQGGRDRDDRKGGGRGRPERRRKGRGDRPIPVIKKIINIEPNTHFKSRCTTVTDLFVGLM